MIGCFHLRSPEHVSAHMLVEQFVRVTCRHRLEIEKERAIQKRSQEAVHTLVTSILRKVCSRYGQAYRPRQTDDAVALVQAATATGVEPGAPAENQENRESEWAKQPLELKVHLYAPLPP